MIWWYVHVTCAFKNMFDIKLDYSKLLQFPYLEKNNQRRENGSHAGKMGPMQGIRGLMQGKGVPCREKGSHAGKRGPMQAKGVPCREKEIPCREKGSHAEKGLLCREKGSHSGKRGPMQGKGVPCR